MTKLAQWLQIGANIGILAGLILVGAQITQSNRITAAQMFDSSIESTIGLQLAMVGESPELAMHRVMYEPENATETDYFVVDRIYGAALRQLFRADQFDSMDLYGNETTDAQGFALVNFGVFANPYGIAYLDYAAKILEASPNTRETTVNAIKLMRELAAASPEKDRRDLRIQLATSLTESQSD